MPWGAPLGAALRPHRGWTRDTDTGYSWETKAWKGRSPDPTPCSGEAPDCQPAAQADCDPVPSPMGPAAIQEAGRAWEGRLPGEGLSGALPGTASQPPTW